MNMFGILLWKVGDGSLSQGKNISSLTSRLPGSCIGEEKFNTIGQPTTTS